ncbi:MAG: NADH-quinone oxidoreductase subunit L [Opitutales bacterium]
MNPTYLLLGIWLTPLVAAVLIALFLRRVGWLAGAVSVAACGTMAVTTLITVIQWDGLPIRESVSWLTLGHFDLRLGFLFDKVAASTLVMVTFVAFLIHLFSLGYMEEDRAKGRYFGGLSIFMFAMTGIVLADNLFMLFIAWELVGFASYMLIGHYASKAEAANASMKAFIVNRVGDFGFLIGIIWCFWHYGTVNLSELAPLVMVSPEAVPFGLAALLICGFIGKSAQFPLHVWLPDAMAGPTPVSALIHAATMVAAGIYLLCRTAFMLPPVEEIILWLGVSMTLYAGFCALAQSDIKRILAYSTLAQLGYMAAAVGLGYWQLALFHMITHAFFKALLFLGAGSVIHACHHEQDIFKMGGLYKRMPITTATFAIGTVALCGVFLTSGYFSKDGIIEAAHVEGDLTAFWLLCLSAFLTALYMGRLFWTAFLGAPKSDDASHARENGWAMCLPLVVLAVLALAGGFLSFWPWGLGEVIKPTLEGVHESIAEAGSKTLVVIVTTLCYLGGLAGSALLYGVGAREDRLAKAVPVVYGFLKQRLWFDAIYAFYVNQIQQRVADLLAFLDLLLINGLLVRGSAGLAGLFGLLGRSLHTGSIQGYVWWFVAGTVLFGAVALGLK